MCNASLQVLPLSSCLISSPNTVASIALPVLNYQCTPPIDQPSIVVALLLSLLLMLFIDNRKSKTLADPIVYLHSFLNQRFVPRITYAIFKEDRMPLRDEINRLKAEIEQLKQQHTQSQSQFDAKLTQFSQQLDVLSAQIPSDPNKQLATDDVVASQPIDSNAESLTELTTNKALEPKREAKVKGKHWHLIESLSNAITELSSTVLAPIASITVKTKQFYQHYQAKGLGPVFLMTLVGIITLTVGFGYLLQFSLNHWLSDLGKALGGLVIANLIICLGVYIRYKRAGMEDFGSGIVGLGLILNYLCLYFLGPYFNIVPESSSFALLLLNTLFGYALSLKLKAKVVAIVALVGGSLAPLMLINSVESAQLYLPYLLLLGACSLFQSYRLAWLTLIQITAVLHIACIQFIGITIAEPFTFAWLTSMLSLHGVFYLYSIGSLYLLIKTTLNSKLLAVPIALFVFSAYQISEIGQFVGEIFLINAAVCALLYLLIKRDKQIAELALVFAASFAGLAALYLLNPNLLGLVLLFEGVLLVWIGSKYQLTAIRFEAYTLLLIGMASSLQALFWVLSIDGVDQTNWSSPLFPCVMMSLTCVMIYVSLWLLKPHINEFSKAELFIKQLGHELLSVFYSLTLVLISFTISEDYFLHVIPIVCALLLYLSARHQLRFTEILAWLWLLPLAAVVAWGIFESDSLSFSVQTLNAKLARVEIFVGLLCAHYWYKRYYPQALLIQIAYFLQLVCLFMLPLLFIPKVLRDFSEYIALAVWISTFISVAVAYISQHKLIRFEATVLTYIAMTLTAIQCLDQHWQGLTALAIGFVFMFMLSLVYNKANEKWQWALKYSWCLTPYYFALTLVVLTQTVSAWLYPNWAISALIICAYMMLSLEKSNRLGAHICKALKCSYRLAYLLLYLVSFVPILLHSQTSLRLNTENFILVCSEVVILALLASYIRVPRLGIRVHQARLPTIALKWTWHIMLILSYLLWTHMLGEFFAATASAILMVVHASVLMFISLRPKQHDLLKLAGILFTLTSLKVLLIDMASFELVQKVVAFIVIGTVLLTVAYFYQRNKNALIDKSS